MSNLCSFKRSLCLLLLAIAICIILGNASSVSMTPEEKLKGLENELSNANAAITTTMLQFVTLKSERDDVKNAYDDNAEEIRDQGIEAAHQGVSLIFIVKLGPLAPAAAVTELRQAITNAELTATDLVEGVRLAKALDIAINKTDKLRTKIGDPANGSQSATGLFKTRDDIYDKYLIAHKAVYSPSVTSLDRGNNDAPIDSTSFSYGCFGSNTCEMTFGSPHAAMTTHFTLCQEKPHKAQEFGWYSCERSSCAKAEEHWRLCPGTCGETFPPKKKAIYAYGIGLIDTPPVYTYVDDFPHEVICKEKVYVNFWNVITNTCYNKYGDESVWYTCEHDSCPNSTHHLDDDDDDTASNPDPPTPAPSPPSYHVCGTHETWQSGSHGAASCGHASHYVCDGKTHQQVQCTSTNANGDQCTYTYWQCLYSSAPSHTHVYPALPAPEPDPEPEGTTCINGHSYDPNNPTANKKHRTKTCRFSECGQTWANCSGSAPICNKPYRNQNGLRCWAID